MTFYSEKGTYPNTKVQGKPNEDYYICDDKEQIYILLDGVSRDKINGVYPNPSPAFAVSKIFGESAYRQLKNTVGNLALKEVIEQGNKEIAQYNNRQTWENDFHPGTVGIIAVVREKRFYYAYIGDCYGVRLTEHGEKDFFTECQTRQIAAHNREFTAYQIRNKICNNIEHPYSYGVLNGDKGAMDFVREGSLELDAHDKIMLCSDGVDDIVTQCSGLELYQMHPEMLKEKSTNQDDKTVIILTCQ